MNGWSVLALLLGTTAIILTGIGAARGAPALCWVAVAASVLACGLALIGAHA